MILLYGRADQNNSVLRDTHRGMRTEKRTQMCARENLRDGNKGVGNATERVESNSVLEKIKCRL